ncbi:MAG: KilA-N domain-containing protein [Treponema sp.]|nr:KilA-N domain-containing protein [Treponema sp.]
MQTVNVKNTQIRTLKINNEDYICITDIARQKNPVEPKDVVKNWLRLKNTIEYLGLWEKLYNSDFKGVEFDPLYQEAGSNAFTMSPTRWVETTNAIGLVTKSGANGGTYAQKDIAFKFASWVSFIYADEADMLNVAMFGKTAKQWREANPNLKGNIRDYASINQLICLSNMENLNAVFINDGLPQSERLEKLNKIAIQQMKVLENVEDRKLLTDK